MVKKIFVTISIIAALVAVAIFAMPFIQAFMRGYEYIDSTVSVLSVDEFKAKFGVDSVSKVYYDYEMQIAEDGETAIVALKLEIYFGDTSYTAFAEGEVIAYDLPSGDILWEGSVDGQMTTRDRTEKIIVAFAKVESSGDVSASVTFSGTACGFAFGDYIMEGEVLEFFKNRFN